MQKIIACTVLVAGLASLTACAPWPHVEHSRPSIAGRLLEDGKPIPGAGVFLGAKPGTNDPCGEAGDRVDVSPVDGRFQIAEHSNALLMQSLLNPPDRTMQLTAVCIRRADGTAQIGALLPMFVDKPASVALDCEISKKRGRDDMGNAQMASPLGQPQFCRAVRVPRAA